MTTRVQRRRGTAAEHAAFTGAVGEITVDTTNNRVVVHDGTTAGGIAAAKLSEVARLSTAQTFSGKQTFDAQIKFSTLPPEYADDTAAAGGGLAVGDVYRTGSALKVRVA